MGTTIAGNTPISSIDARAAAVSARCPVPYRADPSDLHAVAVEVFRTGGKIDFDTAMAVITKVVDAWPDDLRPGYDEIAPEAGFVVQSSSPLAPPPEPEGATRIVLRSHDDRVRERQSPPQMLIDRTLPAGGIGAIVAMPGAGKTLVGIEIARCVAAGAPFLDRDVQAGRVIYACPDSPASTERRMLAIPEAVAKRIDTVAEMPAMPGGIEDLRLAIAAVNAAGDPVRLVVIDTWDSARTHSSEGYAGQDQIIEMTMRALRAMAAELGLAVLVIHHATRADNGRARGSVVFDARADWIAVAEGDGTVVGLKSVKCRDGERGELGMFQIQAVDVGGRPVPVLVPFAAGSRPTPRPAPDDRETAVLAILARHEGEMSKRVLQERTGIPAGSLQRVVEVLRSRGLVEAGRYMVTRAGAQAYEDSLIGPDCPLVQTADLEGSWTS